MGRSLSRIKIINRGSNPLIRYFMFTQKLKNLSDKQVLLISFFFNLFFTVINFFILLYVKDSNATNLSLLHTLNSDLNTLQSQLISLKKDTGSTSTASADTVGTLTTPDFFSPIQATSLDLLSKYPYLTPCLKVSLAALCTYSIYTLIPFLSPKFLSLPFIGTFFNLFSNQASVSNSPSEGLMSIDTVKDLLSSNPENISTILSQIDPNYLSNPSMVSLLTLLSTFYYRNLKLNKKEECMNLDSTSEESGKISDKCTTIVEFKSRRETLDSNLSTDSYFGCFSTDYKFLEAIKQRYGSVTSLSSPRQEVTNSTSGTGVAEVLNDSSSFQGAIDTLESTNLTEYVEYIVEEIP